MSEVTTIFVKGFCVILMASVMIAGLLFIVGETVEHFTP